MLTGPSGIGTQAGMWIGGGVEMVHRTFCAVWSSHPGRWTRRSKSSSRGVMRVKCPSGSVHASLGASAWEPST